MKAVQYSMFEEDNSRAIDEQLMSLEEEDEQLEDFSYFDFILGVLSLIILFILFW